MAETLNALWGLWANPFAPTSDARGEEFVARYLRRTLNPNLDERLLRYYYDLYDWGADSKTCLGPDGHLQNFLILDRVLDAGEAHLLVICGDGETGRRSLKNLIFYEMAKALPREEAPIIVEADLGAHRKEGALGALADFIRDECVRSEPRVSALRLKEFADEARNTASATTATWGTALKRIAQELRAVSEKPVLIHVQGGEHSDTWEVVFDEASAIAQLIVITTSRFSQVDSLWRSLRATKKNLTVVRSGPLTIDQAREFLNRRLSAHRLPSTSLGNLTDLAPFSDESLIALYEKGRQAPADASPPAWPIRWLSETFRKALDEHEQELVALTRAGTEIQPREDLLIRAEDIRKYREDLNAGHGDYEK